MSTGEVHRCGRFPRSKLLGPVISEGGRASASWDLVDPAADAACHRLSAAVDTGMVWVDGTGRAAPSMPFGGVKRSGTGASGDGFAGIDEFSRRKNVWIVP